MLSIGPATLIGFLLVFGVLAAALVVAQRRREVRLSEAQEALKVSEERLRHALEASSDIIWDWDLKTDAIYHPRWAQTYGYPEEVTPRDGHALTTFIHPDDLPGFGVQLDEVKRGVRETMEVEHRMRAASGEWRWMLGKARVVARAPDGEALRIVGTCEDVTDRRRLLERLQLADRMASVGTLAAGVAHEINNPLAFVAGNVAYALEALGPSSPPLSGARLDECRAALSESLEGTRRVERIVRDLKVLSRSDGDRRVPTDVGRALATALHLARNELRQRARVLTRLEDVPPVLADESRLSQVFLNLLVNAAQAIPEGHREANEIEVTLARRGDSALVTVRDTGSGIAAVDLKRIFDPFFTTKPIGIGTGLGLAISERIVTSLGGEIGVESEPGKGTTFRVSLPLAHGAPAVDADDAPAASPVHAGRVLVVDDEPLFCRTVTRVLGRELEIVAVGDPEEAASRIEAGERFDAILSDLIMPVMTGMDLHARLSRAAPDQADRMLFITGGAFTPPGLEFVSRMDGRVLEKPIAPDALRAAVAGVIDRGHATGGSLES
jgi:PAS domain S-box-containing protein